MHKELILQSSNNQDDIISAPSGYSLSLLFFSLFYIPFVVTAFRRDYLSTSFFIILHFLLFVTSGYLIYIIVFSILAAFYNHIYLGRLISSGYRIIKNHHLHKSHDAQVIVVSNKTDFEIQVALYQRLKYNCLSSFFCLLLVLFIQLFIN